MRAITLALLPLVAQGALKGGFKLPPRQGAASPADQEAAVHGLISRLLGDTAASKFNLNVKQAVPMLDDSIEDEADGQDRYDVTATGGMVNITGTTGVALAQGLYWYLREHCNSTVGWGRDGTGECVNLPDPAPDAAGSGTSIVPLRYTYNTCTFGYTMAFWDWSRWETELDWQALHGINMPLSFVGQEYVWRELYRGYGVTDEELAAHFSSLPFLPWERMGNLEGWQGPLSDGLIDARHQLQMKILQRQKAFGMLPVLPAFAGHVPSGLRRVFPNASYTTSQAWNGFNNTYLLQPSDPLFPQIGKKFIDLQTKLYGWTSHLYNADTFNEMNPGSSAPDYLKSSSRAVVEGIKNSDPDGRWVMQAWLFMNGWWTPSNINNYLAGANNSDMLILDLQSDVSPIYTRTNGYNGKSWIWCMLHNFGGRPGVYGDLKGLSTGPLGPLKAAGSTMVGIGLTPEATEQNDIVYELMLDVAWNPGVPDVDQWVARWARGRYPAAREGAQAAWAQLVKAAYTGRQGPPDRRWAMFEVPGSGRRCNIQQLDRAGFTQGWSKLLDLADQMPSGADFPGTYRHDLAIMTGYSVLLKGCDALEAQGSETDTWNYGSRTADQRAKVMGAFANVTSILNDTDDVFSGDPNLQLDCWVSDAAALGSTPAEVSSLRRAARRQLTIWGPVVGDNANLVDYAEKPWGGLMKGYYAGRWNVYAKVADDLMGRGQSITMYGEETTQLIAFEKEFGNNDRAPAAKCAPHGDIVAIAKKMRAKYYPSLV